MKRTLTMIGVISMIFFALPSDSQADSDKVTVSLTTTKGVIELELYSDKAPQTVANFVEYVKAGYFDGTIFHRVIKGFMIQGGGLTQDMKDKPGRKPIKNEADNGLKNLRGTIAMARTMDPNSATSQFFISTVDNAFLDFKSKTSQGWGYCVFGKVVKGLDVVDAIEAEATTTKSGHQDVPVETILIEKAVVLP
jgi:peptidyl-prolyl cis-trans isomerase B (cyclophilin B)